MYRSSKGIMSSLSKSRESRLLNPVKEYGARSSKTIDALSNNLRPNAPIPSRKLGNIPDNSIYSNAYTSTTGNTKAFSIGRRMSLKGPKGTRTRTSNSQLLKSHKNMK